MFFPLIVALFSIWIRICRSLILYFVLVDLTINNGPPSKCFIELKVILQLSQLSQLSNSSLSIYFSSERERERADTKIYFHHPAIEVTYGIVSSSLSIYFVYFDTKALSFLFTSNHIANVYLIPGYPFMYIFIFMFNNKNVKNI